MRYQLDMKNNKCCHSVTENVQSISTCLVFELHYCQSVGGQQGGRAAEYKQAAGRREGGTGAHLQEGGEPAGVLACCWPWERAGG